MALFKSWRMLRLEKLIARKEAWANEYERQLGLIGKASKYDFHEIADARAAAAEAKVALAQLKKPAS